MLSPWFPFAALLGSIAVAAEPSPSPLPSPSASAPTVAEYRVGSLVASDSAQAPIRGLKWKETEEIPLTLWPHGEEFQGRAVLVGEYHAPEDGWILISGDKELAVIDGRFTIEMPVVTRIVDFELTALGPSGEIEINRFKLLVPEWERFAKKAQAAPPKRWNFVPSLGFTLMDFSRSGSVDFVETALTFKASFTFLAIPPRWDLGASVFFNVLPLTSSSTITTRVFGVNVRFGYSLPFIPEPWRLSILPGLSYTTMLDSGGRFGLSHLLYPQLYPVLRRRFLKGDVAFLYFKFVPLDEGFGVSLTNRELGLGAGWIHPLASGHPILVSLDLGDTRLTENAGKKGIVTVVSRSVSASFGYGW